MTAAFDIKNLTLSYDGFVTKAIDDLTYTFASKKFHVILGQNGSGKSSLLKAMAGFQYWNKGIILREGRSRAVDSADFNLGLAFISEEVQITGSLQDLVKISKEVWKSFDESTFVRLLSIGEISDKARIERLSKGQKILTQFALSMATQPSTVIVDEVTAALDPYIRTRIIGELARYQDQNRATVILATNVANEVRGVDTEILIMKDGKHYLSGNFSKIREDFCKIRLPKELAESSRKHQISAILSDDAREYYYIGRRSQIEESSLQSYLVSDPVTLEEVFVYVSDRSFR